MKKPKHLQAADVLLTQLMCLKEALFAIPKGKLVKWGSFRTLGINVQIDFTAYE